MEKIKEMPLVFALGKNATRLAQILKSQIKEQIDLYAIDKDIETSPQILIPHNQPLRFLIYDRSEVAPDIVKKFGTAAKIGGNVICFEIAAHREDVPASWQVGADMLIRTDDESACVKAAEFLLRIAFPTQNVLDLDIMDVFSMFQGTDYARIGMATATGDLAKDQAIKGALREVGWPVSSLRGLLIDITGSEEQLRAMEIDKFMDTIMDKTAEDGNMIWKANIDSNLDDTVHVTVIATRGWKRESEDARAWIPWMVEEKFHEIDEG